MTDDFLIVRRTPETRTYPMRIELANFYYQDAADFHRRFRLTFYSDRADFQSVKSRRAKAYIDLRMALEALLKSVICLRQPRNVCGKPLVGQIRAYRHNIDNLARDGLKNFCVDSRFTEAIDKCRIAPVDLRYQFDAMCFRFPDDRSYYETIGSDAWLQTLEEFVGEGLRRLNEVLKRRSRIVPMEIVAQEARDRPSDYG